MVGFEAFGKRKRATSRRDDIFFRCISTHNEVCRQDVIFAIE